MQPTPLHGLIALVTKNLGQSLIMLGEHASIEDTIKKNILDPSNQLTKNI